MFADGNGHCIVVGGYSVFAGTYFAFARCDVFDCYVVKSSWLHCVLYG